MQYIHPLGEHYFAAANTYNGFESLFEEIFSRDKSDRLYILKGGPGVGKSTFMKKAAAAFEKDGQEVTYYRCSSDPDSLDGIFVRDRKISIVDGTRPHAVEANLAGAYEEIVDLGKAWDTNGLSQISRELAHISSQKSACYKRAYKNLDACKKARDILYSLYDGCLLTEKLSKSAARLAKSTVPAGERFCRKNVHLNAISCKGKIRLCTFEDTASLCIFVKEPYYNSLLAHKFMFLLLEAAQKNKAEVVVSLSPFDTSVIDGLYFPKNGVSVTVYSDELAAKCDREGKKCKIVNTARFVDVSRLSPSGKERKFYEKSAKAFEEKALSELKKAGALHALLEEKYSFFTDYAVVESITESCLAKLTDSRMPRQ